MLQHTHMLKGNYQFPIPKSRRLLKKSVKFKQEKYNSMTLLNKKKKISYTQTQQGRFCFLVQLFGTWMLWKFGSFGMVAGLLLPRNNDLEAVWAEALVPGAAFSADAFATLLGVKIFDEVSLMALSWQGVMRATVPFLLDIALQEDPHLSI